MKIFSDYHNHPLGHDPRRVYSYELLNSWYESALKKEISDIVFTDHDRYHEGVKIDVFKKFKEEKSNSPIKLKLGIELDNDPETSSQGRKWVEKNYDEFDFILGSVHFINHWAFDHAYYREEYKKWNIEELYKTYYLEVQKTIKLGLIDGLGHFDLIKIFNYKLEEKSFETINNLIKETLELAKKANLSIEISTAGLRKPVNEIYPSKNILKFAKEMGIDFTLSSDAHAPDQIAENYTELKKLLQELEITKIVLFENHKKIYIDL